MNNKNDFETFLYISNKKISISVRKKYKDYEFYENTINLTNNLNDKDLSQLNEFLNLNIIKIERSLKKFIKKIILIIDHQELLMIKLSLKKKFYGNLIDKETLGSLLNTARNQVKENHKGKTITHMIIDNYNIDDKFFSSLPENMKCQNLCMDINFICFSEKFLMKIKESLNVYQIEIQQILSASYLRDNFKDSTEDIYSMGQKIIDGHNSNEILFVRKIRKNLGFFERFFNFFN